MGGRRRRRLLTKAGSGIRTESIKFKQPGGGASSSPGENKTEIIAE